MCAKILYQVELSRSTLEQMWGFSVEAELVENADRQDELCCYVSRVEDKSVAMQNGELCFFCRYQISITDARFPRFVPDEICILLPLTSGGVERFFPAFKTVLSADRRHSIVQFVKT